MLAERRNEQKTRLIYENELQTCIYVNVFFCPSRENMSVYISVGFAVVRMNVQILQRKEVLLNTCLKYHVLKFQLVL